MTDYESNRCVVCGRWMGEFDLFTGYDVYERGEGGAFIGYCHAAGVATVTTKRRAA